MGQWNHVVTNGNTGVFSVLIPFSLLGINASTCAPHRFFVMVHTGVGVSSVPANHVVGSAARRGRRLGRIEGYLNATHWRLV